MGNGTGDFSRQVINLESNTVYYARAYAVNILGTAYGNQVSFTTTGSDSTKGSFTDPRDGKTYKWVKIGKQKWMAENLAYLPDVYPPSEPPFGATTVKYYYVYGYEGRDVAAAKATENYSKYGVLYNNRAAMDGNTYSSTNPSGRKCACPEGWHLPSDAEFDELGKYISDQKGPYTRDSLGWLEAGKHLKSTTGWPEGANGTDDFGFNGLPAGMRVYFGYVDQLGMYTRWWTSTLGNMPWAWHLLYTNNNFVRNIVSPYHAISIRCVMDE